MSRLISDKYRAYQQVTLDRFAQLKANEEELNRIFIDIYGLQDELTPDVADKDVTVYRIIDQPNEEERKMPYVISMKEEIVSLLSYMVGCMMGRYSPYLDGLLFAGGAWDYAAICARIEAAAPENDFYNDHLKTYQKRPIYWQFDSGKQNGLKALMYLHRYDPDTVARLRTDYVFELQDRLRVQLEDARKTAETAEGRLRAAAAKRALKLEKQQIEVNKFEEQVHHLADMRIPLDLDDGVKVNYQKLADILTKIK